MHVAQHEERHLPLAGNVVTRNIVIAKWWVYPDRAVYVLALWERNVLIWILTEWNIWVRHWWPYRILQIQCWLCYGLLSFLMLSVSGMDWLVKSVGEGIIRIQMLKYCYRILPQRWPLINDRLQESSQRDYPHCSSKKLQQSKQADMSATFSFTLASIAKIQDSRNILRKSDQFMSWSAKSVMFLRHTFAAVKF